MRLLCWINDSSTDRHAAAIAAELARRADADLRYVDATPVEIREIAEHGGFDLVVIDGTPRGRFASVLGGFMARRFAHRVSVPVLIVPSGAAVSSLDRVVLVYDVGAAPARSATVAGNLAARLGAPLELARAEPKRERQTAPSGWQLYDTERTVARAAAQGHSHSVAVSKRDPTSTFEPTKAGDAIVVISSDLVGSDVAASQAPMLVVPAARVATSRG